MGWHMASHLPKLGHQVWVWNRTEQKAVAHAETFATQAVSIEQAVQADFIFSCLPTSQDVEALIAAHPPKQGAIWIDCTSGCRNLHRNWRSYWNNKAVLSGCTGFWPNHWSGTRYFNCYGGW